MRSGSGRVTLSRDLNEGRKELPEVWGKSISGRENSKDKSLDKFKELQKVLYAVSNREGVGGKDSGVK